MNEYTRKDILIAEYNSLSNLVNNGWTLTYAILTTGLTIFVLLINFTINSKEYSVRLIANICLFLLPITIIIIVGQITKAMYMFSLRLTEIARQFEEKENFWDDWHKHVEQTLKRNFDDKQPSADENEKRRFLYRSVKFIKKELKTSYAGSAPFIIIIKYLYLLAVGFISLTHTGTIISGIVNFNKNADTTAMLCEICKIGTSIILLAAIIYFMPWIRKKISEELDPEIFYPNLIGWNKISKIPTPGQEKVARNLFTS